VVHRLDRLASELGLDRDRARGWTIGQTIAWAATADPAAEHLELVRWLLEEG
jgi:streptomycin 6-kinase